MSGAGRAAGLLPFLLLRTDACTKSYSMTALVLRQFTAMPDRSGWCSIDKPSRRYLYIDMSIAHHRRKRPELVRQQLLEVAARLSFENGIANVTLDAVSQAAGVSKGGLLHHFPNKMALLDGLFDDLTSKFDLEIDEAMRNDPVALGRFSRAYLSVVFSFGGKSALNEDAQAWGVLTIALLAEPALRERWRRWVCERADEFVGTDSSTNCLLVRMAADGLWLADILQSHDLSEEDRKALFSNLKTLSFQ